MKTIVTFAFDVLQRCVRSLDRREVHATAKGFRSVVAFDGQLYEILVNPLYKDDPELEPEEELGNGGEPLPSTSSYPEPDDMPETFEERKCRHDIG